MDYIQQNKRAWEEAFNNRYEDYGKDIVTKIKKNRFAYFNDDMKNILSQYSLREKDVVQFCCNNGRELLSLSYTEKANQCIGFDIAENQINYANEKAQELGLNCEFVACNILDIPDNYYNKFDYALITIGALCWFKNLEEFFKKVALCMKSNGVLFINEQHPVCNVLGLPGDDNYDEKNPTRIVNSYFSKEWINNDGMYYMTKKQYKSETFIDYSHSLSEIINGLVKNGLNIKLFNEYDYDISDGFEQFDHMDIPLSYIIVAGKNS